ncbi:hypothetical protein F4824DRAFT_508369 [Ustulina deusta]|nr:hypothetical protein F4824DRAFT_508369 [Ustulina deusta]
MPSVIQGMNLFWVSDPATPPNLTRAHVAKQAHAVARRERTTKYLARRHKSIPVSSGQETRVDSSLAAASCSPLDSPIFPQSQPECLQDPVSQFESSLVRYYVDAVIPVNEDLTNRLSPGRAYKATVLREWLLVALENHGTHMGLYTSACRSLYARTDVTWYYQYARQYKAACLCLLAESIAAICTSRAPTISDITISTMLQLASDEDTPSPHWASNSTRASFASSSSSCLTLAAGDLLAWGRYVDAINEMVRLSGGLNKIQGVIEVVSSKDVLQLTQRSPPNSAAMASITLEELLQ